MIGGVIKDIVLRQTYCIDENLSFSEMAPMKQARYSSQVALLNNRFILVAGGQNQWGKNKYTTTCELFDISMNKWHPVDQLQKPRSNSSMTAVAGRLVFIFNGLPSSIQTLHSNAIEFLDLVSFDTPSIRTAKWETLSISNNDFVSTEPRGSAAISKTEILVFGGCGSTNTYTFDFSQLLVAKSQNQKFTGSFKITKLADSPLLASSNFCCDCDFIVKTFGNYLYATDGANENLHVFSIKDKQWNFSKLNELGIN